MKFTSKLPQSGNTIFTVMSALATKHKAINLGQGFPDFDCDSKLIELVNKHISEGKNQYCPMAGLPKLREAITGKIRYMYDVDIDFENEICITAGATQAIYTAITAFVNKGDEVILIEPAYDCYKPAVILSGGIPKAHSLKYPDYKVDWVQFESLVNEKTKMIIINTPHNPTGTLLRQGDMKSLEKIIKNKDIIVLSDEVYEHLIFDGEKHQSVLKFPNLFKQSLAVYSFGKTLHATGWKLGYIVGPEILIKEFKNVHQWNVFCVNSFLQFAIADYLEDSENYEYLSSFFEEKRDYLTQSLSNTKLLQKKSEGTYFQLYDYSSIDDRDDVTFAKYLTTEIGVAAIPMSPFYSEPNSDKVIRLCFAKKESTMDAAAERLKLLI